MSIAILLLCFVVLFLSLGVLSNTKNKTKDVLLKTVLVFSATFVFITEFTNFFYSVNFQSILVSWIVVFILNIVYLFLNKEKLIHFIIVLKERISSTFYNFNKYDKFLFFAVVLILLLIFVQGIVYPPNNWDSMTYHMARISNWISHQSVEHYPTHIYRQIYQPPFSEFVIMHFNLLSDGDYFSNSVQFFYLIFSLFSIVSIVELFRLNSKYKLIAIVLSVTIPEVILQSSSTQNDIVVSFFILTTVYYAAKCIKEERVEHYLFLGLSIGLGALTKGTAYLYLAPVIVVFAILFLINTIKSKKYSRLGYSIIPIVLFLGLNSGHFTRNYNLTSNILGVDKNESKMYSNEEMSFKLLISNFSKNAGLHIGPYPINQLSTKVIYKLHSLADVDINNHETNFLDKRYSGSPNIPTHEDSASNPIHFFLIILSVILIGFNFLKNKKESMYIMLYLIVLVLQVMLFCYYLKYQPWHTRLHTPLFLISIPLIVYSLSLKNVYHYLLNKAIIVILIYAFFIVIFNNSRPFITVDHKFFCGQITLPISVFDDRYKKYFANRSDLYEEYAATAQKINKMKCKNIGLVLGGDDWEYPLFLKCNSNKINSIHLNVSNITKNSLTDNKKIDCILSTTVNDSLIDFNGKRFYNLSPNNRNIWIYK